ncbi:MAG: polyketide cyclase [Methylobacterium sp.]|jgi:hypothetical protein|nr:polyketide cyclase [Methylobacterium sp.]MCA3646422.1 polyketide cyclase [Methylobacterium sp.]MCA3651434.1 polyketide cyclase [Methylobacterium sp.]MCA4924512.1 polyketide cyclase [Methylobacterium sp.]MCE2932422.1 ester cyclase [Hyphomicrobiales bacterium]
MTATTWSKSGSLTGLHGHARTSKARRAASISSRWRFTHSAGVALLATTLPALANDRATVDAFYTESRTAAGPWDKAMVAARILASDWKSCGDYSGKAHRPDGLTAMLVGLHQLMPDLVWKIEKVLQAGNLHVVRGRATGTPKGMPYGVDGKIVGSDHVEDWAGALRQLSGPDHSI